MKGQPRQEFDMKDIAQLAASYRHGGQVDSCTVMLLPSAQRSGEVVYELVSGERRWRACKKAGSDVLIRVIEWVDDAHKRYLMAAIANMHQKALSPLETALMYQRLKNGGMSTDEIADAFGVSRFGIDSYIALLRLPDETKELMSPKRPESQRLPHTVAHKLLMRFEEHPAELNRLALRVVEKGLRTKDLDAIIAAKSTKLGTTARRNQRQPGRARQIVMTFVDRVDSETRVFDRYDDQYFAAMFEGMYNRDLRRLDAQLEKVNERLARLKKRVGSLLNKRG